MLSSEFRFDAIGAPWRIDTATPLGAALRERIAARIDRFDRDWSRFRDDSLVSQIARAPGRWRLPDDAGPMLRLYETLYSATSGRLSPLVGQRLAELGYDAAYSLRPSGRTTPVPAWADAVAWDGEHLTTLTPVTLDVGAAGKGYLVDLVCALLDDEHDEYLVDASGDLRHRGPVAVRVALEHPARPGTAIGVCELRNAALCASAPNRRAWGPGLHHILDALTGVPTETVAATWVVAPTALVADGIATALFLSAAAPLRAELDFEYVRLVGDTDVDHSPGFSGEVFRA